MYVYIYIYTSLLATHPLVSYTPKPLKSGCRPRVWVSGFGFKVWGLGLGVYGLGFGVGNWKKGLGLEVWGLGLSFWHNGLLWAHPNWVGVKELKLSSGPGFRVTTISKPRALLYAHIRVT